MQADVWCRPAGAGLFHHQRNTQNISLGGARVYANERFPVGSRLDLEVQMPDATTVRCWAEVVWLSELDDRGPAKFDVGLSFVDMSAPDVQRLASVLGPAR